MQTFAREKKVASDCLKASSLSVSL